MWNLLTLSKPNSKEDKKLVTAIKTIAGFTPSNIAIYRLATLHSSKAKDVSGFRESNERLEYLGDAILGAAVADYLFKKYPFKDEGFLTEIRSRIVNRESLNNLARKIGIAAIVQYDNRNTQLQKVILGNTLEALVGAVYLDKGYLRCKKFVIDKLIQPYFIQNQLYLSILGNFGTKSHVRRTAKCYSVNVRRSFLQRRRLSQHLGDQKLSYQKLGCWN